MRAAPVVSWASLDAEGDEAEERWRLLGKVLAARAPELLEQTATMLEHVVAVMADRSETDPESEIFVIV
jgi:hypothetical protein